MSDEITLPEDEQELSILYQETIDHHHNYLEKLHSAFNRRCEKIGGDTKEGLKDVPENSEEGKQALLTKEQELLDKTLAELKYAINKSNANARKKLEEIQNKMEEGSLNLENELAEL